MAKTVKKTTKTRSPQDTTLRNARASLQRDLEITERLDRIEARLINRTNIIDGKLNQLMQQVAEVRMESLVPRTPAGR